MLTLSCQYIEAGIFTDIVTLDLEPGGTIDLAVGAEVQFFYEAQSSFEGPATEILRITDDRGLVLGAGRSHNLNWSADDPTTHDFLELALPLIATTASCTDDPSLHAVEVARDAASVVVGGGGSALLTADATWRIVVEHAAPQGKHELAILRVTP